MGGQHGRADGQCAEAVARESGLQQADRRHSSGRVFLRGRPEGQHERAIQRAEAGSDSFDHSSRGCGMRVSASLCAFRVESPSARVLMLHYMEMCMHIIHIIHLHARCTVCMVVLGL